MAPIGAAALPGASVAPEATITLLSVPVPDSVAPLAASSLPPSLPSTCSVPATMLAAPV